MINKLGNEHIVIILAPSLCYFLWIFVHKSSLFMLSYKQGWKLG
jgi:hypothetical protein